MNIEELLAQWEKPDGKPYKGKLIDYESWRVDQSPSCMCAQGQVLHYVAGWSASRLRDSNQFDADTATMAVLGISRAHAVLLRNINDSVDGAPCVVITNPEKVIGEHAPIILAFWRHLDRMTKDDWDAARDAAGAAARDAARDAAGAAAWATNEIQGHKLMEERRIPLTFLPMFGFEMVEQILEREIIA